MRRSQRFKKSYRVKPKKSLLRNKFFWYFILFGLFLAGSFYLLFLSRFSQIQKIEIAGNKTIDTLELQNIVQKESMQKILTFQSSTILLVDTKKIQTALLNHFPVLESAEVIRKLPKPIISVIVKERKALSAVCRGDICFAFDGNGVIFEHILPTGFFIRDERTSVPEFLAGAQVFSPEEAADTTSIKQKLSEDLKLEAKEFILQDNKRLNALMQEGWSIFFNLKEKVSWQTTELALVLNEKIPQEKRKTLDYVDLRFTRVYFKYR